MSYKSSGIKINIPVMNAACSITKSMEDLEALLATRADTVVLGSVTWLGRQANPEPNWFAGDDQGFALNSVSMPNEGHEWYQTNLPEMVERTHAAGKRLLLNVAGFSTDEYSQLAEMAKNGNVDGVEFNLGCPNTVEAGWQNPIFSFDVDALQIVLRGADRILSPKTPYMVKLSPYSNPAELSRVASVIGESKAGGVVTTNTFPNSYWQNNAGRAVILPNNGLAGMSGEAMLPIGLGQVKQFRQQLPESKIVIGVGGITRPEHIEQYLRAGAAAVQVATYIVRNGHQAINDLIM